MTRLKVVILGALLLGIGSTTAFTQGPSPDRRRGGGGGYDPDAMFDRMAKGKDVIVISEVEFGGYTEKMRESMNAYLKEKGLSGGQLTREQYRGYSTWSMEKMRERMQQGGGKFGSPKSSEGDKKDSSSQESTSSGDVDARTAEFFKRLDTNGDGFLSVEELQAAGRMGEWLYRELANIDTNKDGKIDLKEYAEFTKARFSRGRSGDGKGDGKGKGGPTFNRELDDEKPKGIPEEKRVVYRIGSLPKELPSWYTELDKDKDGQIGLYEWKAAGKDVKEFLEMDTNKDGFVTVEEILRAQRAAAAKKESQGKLTSLLPMQSIVMPGAGSAQPAKQERGLGFRGQGKGKGGAFKGKGGG
jgi:Ca2+-binding EF-hand superfamily protein